MSGLLQHYGLLCNPFNDRTAEQSNMHSGSFYTHSELAQFTPSPSTYLCFGRRGSGKTTIRKHIEKVYEEYNSKEAKPFFIVNLCEPGHLNDFLINFRLNLQQAQLTKDKDGGKDKEIDCVVSSAITKLIEQMYVHGSEIEHMLLQDPGLMRMKQFLILAHLYGKISTSALLMNCSIVLGAAVPVTLLARNFSDTISQTVGKVTAFFASQLERLPFVSAHPRLGALALGCLGVGGFLLRRQYLTMTERRRVEELTKAIRVLSPTRHQHGTAALLHQLFTEKSEETAANIQSNWVGTSPNNKLEKLRDLVKALGYRGLAIFGDCFDEVELLDPIQNPLSLKKFACEICRNDILSFGYMHFFFPDSRQKLNLNTSSVVEVSRFDRHTIRDLSWSRQQLRELAERRFTQNQDPKMKDKPTFTDMFQQIKQDDLESSLAKLETPRQLFICMSHLFSRLEQNQSTDYQATAPDVEISVAHAQRETV